MQKFKGILVLLFVVIILYFMFFLVFYNRFFRVNLESRDVGRDEINIIVVLIRDIMRKYFGMEQVEGGSQGCYVDGLFMYYIGTLYFRD